MDFSTVDRALASLPRRRPPLPGEVLNLSGRMLDLLALAGRGDCDGVDATAGDKSDDGGNDNDVEYVRGMLRMIDLGGGSGFGSGATGFAEEGAEGVGAEAGPTPPRWEPLAVGLRLAVDYLERTTAALPRSTGEDDHDEEDDDDEGTGLGTGGGGVYAEGPRVPEVVARPPPARGKSLPGAAAAASSAESGGESLLPPTPPPPSATSPAFALLAALPPVVAAHVEHPEPRVRSLVAQVVGAHARLAASLPNLAGGIGDDADHRESSREGDELLATAIEEARRGRREVHATILSSLKEHLRMTGPSRAENPSAASDGALDDTSGWRALETNLHALASYVDGCGVGGGAAGGGTYADEELRLLDPRSSPDDDDGDAWFLAGLQMCCMDHVNRHVRAAGAAVLGVLVKSCVRSKHRERWDLLVDEDSALRVTLREVLRSTLADNWSQVRMAGSVLCRRFVRALLRVRSSSGGKEANEEADGDDEELTAFEDAAGDLVPILLPRMCLNRFYIAQGVKLYSQGTWRLVFGGTGEEALRGGGGAGAVARSAAPLCRYYAKMCDADNHAVREAACQGVAELAQKVGQHPIYAEYLSPYVTMLLQALLMCFHDESWPVRDEACLACGTFCRAYAVECAPELPTLFSRWTEQLTDQIWSVREDAAVALGDAITAYGPEMFQKVLATTRKGIPAARDQPPMSREEYKKLQNDAEAHTGNQLYSCGSLAPKLRKGGAGRIGCMSCLVNRPKAPWEATDGCVYLLRELCVRFANQDDTEREGIIMTDDVLVPLLTELADVCRLSHYPQSDDLRTTLWRQLPPIAEALGKRRFKRMYLDLFVELLAKNLDDRYGSGASQLSIHAAGQCAEELANLIGVGILRGRIEEATGGADAFDRVLEERRKEQHGVADGHGCRELFQSPFGPPVAGSVA